MKRPPRGRSRRPVPTSSTAGVVRAPTAAFDGIRATFASCGSAHDFGARTAGSETRFRLNEVLSQPSRSSPAARLTLASVDDRIHPLTASERTIELATEGSCDGVGGGRSLGAERDHPSAPLSGCSVVADAVAPRRCMAAAKRSSRSPSATVIVGSGRGGWGLCCWSPRR